MRFHGPVREVESQRELRIGDEDRNEIWIEEPDVRERGVLLNRVRETRVQPSIVALDARAPAELAS